MTTPTRLPSALTRCTVRCKLLLPSQWTRNESEPASTNSSRKTSGSEIIRCVSSGRRVTRPQRLDDRRSHRNVGHEVAIHHIHVDPVGSGLLRLGHLLAQTGEVSRENRRGKFHNTFVHISILLVNSRTVSVVRPRHPIPLRFSGHACLGVGRLKDTLNGSHPAGR